MSTHNNGVVSYHLNNSLCWNLHVFFVSCHWTFEKIVGCFFWKHLASSELKRSVDWNESFCPNVCRLNPLILTNHNKACLTRLDENLSESNQAIVWCCRHFSVGCQTSCKKIHIISLFTMSETLLESACHSLWTADKEMPCGEIKSLEI